MSFLNRIFKSENTRNVEKLEKIAKKVEDLSEVYKNKTDEELKNTTVVLKERIKNGEKLIDILPDAFACVREASDRVLGMRHFHVQILGGIALFQGRIAEMRTGEGKTLVETLPAYLVALEGKGVHIVTVNEYLTKRDAEWMGKVFKFLGLTVGVVTSNMRPDAKRKAYACDITYSTNNELGFDYLRDNMAIRKQDRMARGYHFAIVDEVDSILIDEARTPLIISGMGMKSGDEYIKAAKWAKTLKPEDYEIDLKDKQIRLTDEGIAKAERYYKIDNLGDIDNIELNHHIRNALQAQYIMKKDENYIVKDGKIVIVDEFTGRHLEGRQYSNGLHQAIEAKEGVEIKEENKALATITFQNFFKIYNKLSGMTGTAKTEEIEFNKIYKLDVVTIPTNLPIKRIDYPDVIFENENAKFRNVAQDVARMHETGRPILVGTTTIEKSERVSKELTKLGIKHNVLNAKNHERESEIVAQAGRLGQVTIATNMAGRGTDILLGGNPEYLAKQKLKEQGVDDESLAFCTSFAESDDENLNEIRNRYKKIYAEYKKVTDAEKAKVVELGGLHIIGTERHESRRIDNQLRGRAGRQGDPGSSVFYVSMDDELLKRLGGEKMQGVLRFFKVDENISFKLNFLSRQIERAQKKMEAYNFGIRNSVMRYDDVLNVQREIIYKERNRVLDGEDVHEEIVGMISDYVDDIVIRNVDDTKMFDEWDLDKLNSVLNETVFHEELNFVTSELVDGMEVEELSQVVVSKAIELFNEKSKSLTEIGVNFSDFERTILLKVVDTLWIDHIDYMNMLKTEISATAYGQQDPIIAYKKESFEVFDNMILKIREEVAIYMLAVKFTIERIEPKQQKPQQMITNKTENSAPQKEERKIGRNELCPCGSGKKYKNCCGKNN